MLASLAFALLSVATSAVATSGPIVLSLRETAFEEVEVSIRNESHQDIASIAAHDTPGQSRFWGGRVVFVKPSGELFPTSALPPPPAPKVPGVIHPGMTDVAYLSAAYLARDAAASGVPPVPGTIAYFYVESRYGGTAQRSGMCRLRFALNPTQATVQC